MTTTTVLTMIAVYCIASLPCALAIGAVLRRGRAEWGDSRAAHDRSDGHVA